MLKGYGILAGQLKVLLPGKTEWLEINGDWRILVPANTKFKLNVTTLTVIAALI